MFKWLSNYFTYAAWERNGIVLLLTLAALALVSPRLYFYFRPVKPVVDTTLQSDVQAFLNSTKPSNLPVGATDLSDTAPVSSTGPNKQSQAPATAAASLNINRGDSAAFEGLPGIGPVLAHRILNFRRALGGYASVEQLQEVWGLPDSTYRRLKPRLQTDGRVTQIDLNTADAPTLSRHPYLSGSQAKAIITYRKKNGNFTSPDGLRSVSVLPDSTLRKLKPYLTVKTR